MQGCDSTIVLHVAVEPVFSDTLTQFVPLGNVFQGVPIFNDTVFVEHHLAQNGCDSTVTTLVFAVNTASEDLDPGLSLSIFPNPARDRFFVRFFLPEMQDLRLEVHDMIGQQVVYASQNGTRALGLHTVEIGTVGWTKGVYLVRLVIENAVVAGKLVVK